VAPDAPRGVARDASGIAHAAALSNGGLSGGSSLLAPELQVIRRARLSPHDAIETIITL